MEVDQTELKLVEGELWPGEQVIGTVQQRRFMPGGSVITPTTVIVTDKRLIIVNKATLGLRKDYESIPYQRITSVRREHGLISSTVFIRVEGYDHDKGLLAGGKEEGEIDGLKNKQADELSDLLSKLIGGAAEQEGAPGPGQGGFVFCTKCGTKNAKGSKFCSNCGAQLI